MKKTPSPLESAEQKNVVKWLNNYGAIRWPELIVPMPDGPRFPVFSFRNEGKMSPRQGKHFKEMGLFPSVPDFLIPVPRGVYSGLFVEMKRVYPKGKVTAGQRVLCDWLNKNGYKSIIAFGSQNAIEQIIGYMG